MPQWSRSVWVSRQAPEQLVVPAPQETAQVPPEQTCPAAQTRPHMPQLRASVVRSRQAPEQSVKPVAQDTLQAPPEQT